MVAAGLSVVLIVLSYAYSPRGYAIQEGSIVVKRLIGNARISLDDVRELRAADADDFRGCIRLFGDGGLFGYYGLFRNFETWEMLVVRHEPRPCRGRNYRR
jgi:hypothetical protein